MRKELEFLIDIIKEASSVIDENAKVSQKDNPDKGYDLVTETDLKVEKLLIKKMKATYPAYDIISEEFNPEAGLSKNCFIIDPIDGTINFARGIPSWVIQAACITNSELVASVIYVPKTEELFYAEKGKGAYLNGNRIRISNTLLMDSTIFVSSRFTKLEQRMAYFKLMEAVAGTRNLGSAAVSFAYVAAGRFDGGALLHYTTWDTIPGILMAQEAGGFVFDKPGEYVLVANSKNNLETLKQKVKEGQ